MLNRHQYISRANDDLRKRTSPGIIFYILLSSWVLFSNGYFYRHPQISTSILFSIVFISLLRFVHLYITKIAGERYRTLNDRIFLSISVVLSLAWGLFFAFMLTQREETSTRLLITVCSAGIIAGATVSFAPNLFVVIVYDVVFLVPGLITLLFISPDWSLAVVVALFLFYLILIAIRGNRAYWEALENEYLLEVRSKEFEKISRIDKLTGLYNRRCFDQLFHEEWCRAKRRLYPLSFIILDIDFFKKVNDQYGHLGGDDYLRFFSDQIRKTFRRNIDIYARYGGEEFVVLLGEPKEKAVEMTEVLRKRVEEGVVTYEGSSIATTLSAGIATVIPTGDMDSGILVTKADEMLYQSKDKGRNRITCWSVDQSHEPGK